MLTLLTTQNKYLIAFIFLLLAEWIFLRIAKRMDITARMSDHSAHSKATPTCGGIIVLLATIAFAVVDHSMLSLQWWLMLGSALILGIVSFYDDLHPLPPLPRMALQIACVALVFNRLCTPTDFALFMLIILGGVGCVNVFNFIDGICGMLALYGAVVVGTLLYAVELAGMPDSQLYISLCIMLLLAILAFAIFNLPDKIFAGDVGSVTLGFFVSFVLINLILFQQNASPILFISVGIFDTGLTTVQRLFAGENILLPHRMCIYQILTDKWHVPHLVVSSAYALLQLLINALYFLIPSDYHYTYLLSVIGSLTVLYFVIRHRQKIS